VLVQAWTTAWLQRTKKLPPLKRLLKPHETRVLSGAEAEERRREFAALKQAAGET
jgi:hypothetical protein